MVQIVGTVVSAYPPGGDDIAYVSSSEPLPPYLLAARTALSPLTSARRVTLMTLLKMFTYRMTAQDLSHIVYFGHVVNKMV